MEYIVKDAFMSLPAPRAVYEGGTDSQDDKARAAYILVYYIVDVKAGFLVSYQERSDGDWTLDNKTRKGSHV